MQFQNLHPILYSLFPIHKRQLLHTLQLTAAKIVARYSHGSNDFPLILSRIIPLHGLPNFWTNPTTLRKKTKEWSFLDTLLFTERKCVLKINGPVSAEESYLMHTALHDMGKRPLHSVENSVRLPQPTVWSLGHTSRCSQISLSPSRLSNTNQAIQSNSQKGTKWAILPGILFLRDFTCSYACILK